MVSEKKKRAYLFRHVKANKNEEPRTIEVQEPSDEGWIVDTSVFGSLAKIMGVKTTELVPSAQKARDDRDDEEAEAEAIASRTSRASNSSTRKDLPDRNTVEQATIDTPISDKKKKTSENHSQSVEEISPGAGASTSSAVNKFFDTDSFKVHRMSTLRESEAELDGAETSNPSCWVAQGYQGWNEAKDSHTSDVIPTNDLDERKPRNGRRELSITAEEIDAIRNKGSLVDNTSVPPCDGRHSEEDDLFPVRDTGIPKYVGRVRSQHSRGQLSISTVSGTTIDPWRSEAKQESMELVLTPLVAEDLSSSRRRNQEKTREPSRRSNKPRTNGRREHRRKHRKGPWKDLIGGSKYSFATIDI